MLRLSKRFVRETVRINGELMVIRPTREANSFAVDYGAHKVVEIGLTVYDYSSTMCPA